MRTPLIGILSSVFLMCAVATVAAQSTGKPTGPELHARLFNVYLKNLSERCAGEQRTPECINGFWKIADVTGDGLLSIAEITRCVRMIAGHLAYRDYVSKFENYKPTALTTPPENEEGAWVTGAAAIGPFVARYIVANFDYNDDGQLSKGEVLHDIAEDLVLSSVDKLPDELRSQATKALQFLLPLLNK